MALNLQDFFAKRRQLAALPKAKEPAKQPAQIKSVPKTPAQKRQEFLAAQKVKQEAGKAKLAAIETKRQENLKKLQSPEFKKGFLPALAKGIKYLAVEVPFRAAAGFLSEADRQRELAAAKRQGLPEPPVKEYLPKGKVEQFFLGQQPIKPITRTPEAESIAQLATMTGSITPGQSKKFVMPIAGLALGALDIIPGFGGAKKTLIKSLASRIAKTTEEEVITDLLKGVVKGSEDDIIKLSKSLVPMTDKKAVENILTNTIRTEEQVAKGAAKAALPEAPATEKAAVPEIKAALPAAESIPKAPITKKYPTIHEGGKIKMVEGEPVKIVDGIDTFAHQGDGGWVVSEASTGRFIAESRSKEGAIAKAAVKIDEVGPEKLAQQLAKHKLPSSTKTTAAKATETALAKAAAQIPDTLDESGTQLVAAVKSKYPKVDEAQLIAKAKKIAARSNSETIRPEHIAEAARYETSTPSNLVIADRIFQKEGGLEDYFRRQEVEITKGLDPDLPKLFEQVRQKTNKFLDKDGTALFKAMVRNIEKDGALNVKQLRQLNTVLETAKKIQAKEGAKTLTAAHLAEAWSYRDLKQLGKDLASRTPQERAATVKRVREVMGKDVPMPDEFVSRSPKEAPKITSEKAGDTPQVATKRAAVEAANPGTTPRPSTVLPEVVPIEQAPLKRARHIKAVEPSFELPPETRVDYLVRQIQDRFNRLFKTQQAIKKAGGIISEEADAYLQTEMFYGRAAERLEQTREAIVGSSRSKGKALLQRAAKDGVSLDELGDYLHAKHAPERNARIAEINPNLPDGGSGFTNAKAAEILANFEKSGKTAKLEQYAQEFYQKITNRRLKILEESGLETPETVERIRSAYENYVPLKIDKAKIGGRGKGFSVSGKNIFRAKGSTKVRVNPVIQALADLEDTIVKAEKNRASQAFLKLAQENPNPALWKVEGLKYVPRFDAEGEIQFLAPQFKYADNVLEVRVGGKVKLITIEDKALADAMKNISPRIALPFLVKINDYLRAVNTVINPEFVITNFERDIQTALLNVGGEQGGQMAGKVAKNIPAAMRGIYREIRGAGGRNLIGTKAAVGDEWAQLYQEMKLAGGKVGWFDNETIEQKTKGVIEAVNRYNSSKTTSKLARAVDTLGEYISNANEVVESAVRLSAYKAAKDAGFSPARAAQLAKNLTVNFNKKGNIGVLLNSLYLFANAGIQGSARLLTALKNPRTRKIVLGAMAASYGINELNRAINEEEYDKISDFEKQTNLIFMLPNGNYIKWKLPYGYNIFKSIADETYNQVHGKKNIGQSMTSLLMAADTAFNPLNSATPLQFLSPTIADPLVQQLENKNWFGGPIKPEQSQYGPKVRESSLFFGSVRQTSRAIADWLNNITGGSAIEAGAIDISPEILDHYIDFMGGGVLRFIANTFETGANLVKGDLPDVKNMPFVRQLIGTPFEEYERSKVYELVDKSAVRKLTGNEMEIFGENIRGGLKDGTITQEQAKKAFTELDKNQRLIDAGRLFDRLKSMTPEQRAKVFSNLTEQEQKDLTTVMDRQKTQITAAKNGQLPKFAENSLVKEDSLMDIVATYAKALKTDPATAFNRIFSGQKIIRVDKDTIIVARMPLSESQAIKQELGSIGDMKLDHTIPLELGGSNDKSNLQLVSNDLWKSFTPMENYLAKKMKAGDITKAQAQDYIKKFKSGRIKATTILNRTGGGNSYQMAVANAAETPTRPSNASYTKVVLDMAEDARTPRQWVSWLFQRISDVVKGDRSGIFYPSKSKKAPALKSAEARAKGLMTNEVSKEMPEIGDFGILGKAVEKEAGGDIAGVRTPGISTRIEGWLNQAVWQITNFASQKLHLGSAYYPDVQLPKTKGSVRVDVQEDFDPTTGLPVGMLKQQLQYEEALKKSAPADYLAPIERTVLHEYAHEYHLNLQNAAFRRKFSDKLDELWEGGASKAELRNLKGIANHILAATDIYDPNDQEEIDREMYSYIAEWGPRAIKTDFPDLVEFYQGLYKDL